MPVLFRYCLMALWPPFLLATGVWVFILNLLYTFLTLLQYFFGYHAGLMNCLRLLVYIQPSYLILAIPIGFLTGVLVVYGRLGADRETVAVESCGFPVSILMWPMIFFSALLGMFLVVFMDISLPWGNTSFLKLESQVLAEHSAIVVRERVFIQDFPGFELYVDGKDPGTGTLKKVTVFVLGDNGRVYREVFAQEGVLRQDPTTYHVLLDLSDGSMQQAGDKRKDTPLGEFYQMKFKSCLLDLNVHKAKPGPADLGGARNSTGMRELALKIQQGKKDKLDTREEEIDFHKKFSIPFSTLAFAFIGIPLGLRARSGSLLGPVLALALVAIYDAFLLFGEAGGADGILSPFMSMWLPNFILILVGLGLTYWLDHRHDLWGGKGGTGSGKTRTSPPPFPSGRT